LRIVCTAIFMTCGKHLLDESGYLALVAVINQSRTECDYHGGKMENQLLGVVLQSPP
jgi:hypothetical protein